MTVCGIRADDERVVCWGFSQDGNTAAPAGRFRDVSVIDITPCGITSDTGALLCWGLLERKF